MEKPILSAEAVEALLAWYAQSKRDLPWRRTRDPYCIWISEIMLQQTRVEAVKPYYARFLSVCPTVKALAELPEEQLLKLWEGLGYYSRARNLQKAARAVLAEHEGSMPADYRALLRLPGIGEYTAGAIASIAFGIPAPAVDGNVLRVLARVLADTRNILDARVKRDYEAALMKVTDPHRPGDFNQALIELGATLCGPNLPPDCARCPLAAHCLAHKKGLTDVLPVREKKKPRRREYKTVLWLRDGTHTLLHRRDKTGLLAGLYELPSLEGEASEEEILAYVRSLGLEPIRLQQSKNAKHVFTHVEWHMTGYEVSLADTNLPTDTPLSAAVCGSSLIPDSDGDFVFATTVSLGETYAIPTAFAKLLPEGARRRQERSAP